MYVYSSVHSICIYIKPSDGMHIHVTYTVLYTPPTKEAVHHVYTHAYMIMQIYTHIYIHIYIYIKLYIDIHRYGLNMGIGRTCMTPAASSSPMRHDLGFAEGEPWRRQGFNAPQYARKSIFWVPLNPPPPAPVAPPAHTQHCFHNLSQLCICYCSSTHTTTCRINREQEHLSQQHDILEHILR